MHKTDGLSIDRSSESKLLLIHSHLPAYCDETTKDATTEMIRFYRFSICLLFQSFRDISDFDYHKLTSTCDERTKKMISNIQLLQKCPDEDIRSKISKEKYESIIADLPQFDSFYTDLKTLDNDILHNESLLHSLGEDITSNNSESTSSYESYTYIQDYDISKRDYADLGKNKSKIDAIKIITPTIWPDFLVPTTSVNYNFPTTNISSNMQQPSTNELHISAAESSAWQKHFKSSFKPTTTNTEMNTPIKYLNYSSSPSTILISDSSTITHYIDECSAKFTLNHHQSKTFSYIANHLMSENSNQLIAYIGGEGGTGKSQIIKCITHLYNVLGKAAEMRRMAFTGTAAYNIQGRTIDSQIIYRTKKNGALNKLLAETKWANIKVQLIDEISFCGMKLIEKLSNYQNLLHNTKSASFGGIHTLFFGDYNQLLSIDRQFHYSHLFKQIKISFILTEQMRAASDPPFKDFLNATRDRLLSKEHYRYISELIITNATKSSTDSFDYTDATYISPLKLICWHVNNIKALEYSLKCNNIHYIICSYDTINNQRISNHEIRDTIYRRFSSPKGTNAYYRTVELSIGSKITLVRNITGLSEYGITNGSTGTVHAIVNSTATANHRHQINASTVLYTYPPIIIYKPDVLDEALSRLCYPGMPEPGLFPIYPGSETLSVPIKQLQFSALRVKRVQIPFTGGYAMTDYKSQGRTFNNVIIDLDNTRAAASPYVMCSRATSKSALRILSNFTGSVFTNQLDKDTLSAVSYLNSINKLNNLS